MLEDIEKKNAKNGVKIKSRNVVKMDATSFCLFNKPTYRQHFRGGVPGLFGKSALITKMENGALQDDAYYSYLMTYGTHNNNDIDMALGRGEQVSTHYLPGAGTNYERKNSR